MPEVKQTVETVTMKDGKIVEFPGKRRLLKTSNITPEGKVVVRLDFRNAEFREFTLPDTLLLKAAAHGAEQKLGDETAGLEDADDMVMAVDELIDRLYNGDWNARREGNGMAGTSILLRALHEFHGASKSVDQLREWLKGKTAAQKMALRANPKIAPIVKRMEEEKAARSKTSNINTDALLDELGTAAAA